MHVLYLFLKNPGIFLKKFLRGGGSVWRLCLDREISHGGAVRLSSPKSVAFRDKLTQCVEMALIDVAINFCILCPLPRQLKLVC